jgi:tetrahydromethanopterin S-methyltransferase subunit B
MNADEIEFRIKALEAQVKYLVDTLLPSEIEMDAKPNQQLEGDEA